MTPIPVLLAIVTANAPAPGPEPAEQAPHVVLRRLCEADVIEMRAKLYKNARQDSEQLVAEAEATVGAREDDAVARRTLEDRRGLLAKAQQEHADAEALSALCQQRPWDELGELEPGVALTLPRSYYGAVGVDVCTSLETPIPLETSCADPTAQEPPSACEGVARRALDKMPPGSGGSELLAACAPAAGSAAALLGLAVPVAQGLSDFIQARGKEELYDYAIERFGIQVCDGWPDEVGPTVEEVPIEDKSKPAALLRDTCRLMFPRGLKARSNMPALRNARLQDTLRSDLVRLPGRLLEQALEPSTGGAPLVSVAIAIGFGDAVLAILDGRPVRELFSLWAEGSHRHVGEARLACRLFDGSTVDPTCAPLLLLEISAQAGQRPSGLEQIASAIELGLTGFCRRYGGEGCGIETKQIAELYRNELHQVATEAALLGQELGAIEQSLDDGKRTRALPSELRMRALPELESTSERAITVLFALDRRSCPQGNDDPDCAAAELQRAVLESTAGLFDGDYRRVLRAVSIHLPVLLDRTLADKCQTKSGTLQKQCDVRGRRRNQKVIEDTLSVLAFAVDLSEAHSREEAAQIIETAAAERGRYKMKYGRGKATVTLNAFPGFLGGGQTRFNLRSDEGGNVPKEQTAAFRFSAAVGVDWTFRYPRRSTHVGLFFPILDPLAITTFDLAGEISNANFVGIISPGALLRVGLRESPVVLAGGFTWNPLLEDDRSCGAAGPCWRGAIVYGASIAVDVTLLALR